MLLDKVNYQVVARSIDGVKNCKTEIYAVTFVLFQLV